MTGAGGGNYCCFCKLEIWGIDVVLQFKVKPSLVNKVFSITLIIILNSMKSL